jgi:flavorubredoxin
LFGGGLLHTPARSPTRSAAALEAAKRYYAEIMRPFRQPVRRNLDKVRTRDIRIIAPSHGPAYDEPQIIFDAYRDWASDAVCNEVVLPYVTMHHSTQRLVDALVDALVA